MCIVVEQGGAEQSRAEQSGVEWRESALQRGICWRLGGGIVGCKTPLTRPDHHPARHQSYLGDAVREIVKECAAVSEKKGQYWLDTSRAGGRVWSQFY